MTFGRRKKRGSAKNRLHKMTSFRLRKERKGGEKRYYTFNKGRGEEKETDSTYHLFINIISPEKGRRL